MIQAERYYPEKTINDSCSYIKLEHLDKQYSVVIEVPDSEIDYIDELVNILFRCNSWNLGVRK